jgi:ribosomal protein S27AE
MNKELTKHIRKTLNNTNINAELTPGSVDRRYEPAGGVKAHNERIHRESSYVDKYKNLPFTFSKPKKAKPLTTKVCANCGSPVSVTRHTVGIICSKCKKYSEVVEVSIEER